MTKIPSDDILEILDKLRIRESDKLKTVLELYKMEIHQKKAEPDYHRLKTMVKRSIEQNLRVKNFGIRNGNYERNAVDKNQGTEQREQRCLGDCWQWKANGQCSKGDNCSFRHDVHKRAKSSRARITSKELAQLHPVKNGILGSSCSTSPKMDVNLGMSALTHTARLTNSLARSLEIMVTKLQWLC